MSFNSVFFLILSCLFNISSHLHLIRNLELLDETLIHSGLSASMICFLTLLSFVCSLHLDQYSETSGFLGQAMQKADIILKM